jgi:spore germination cell wall hydrolase CwlJ-like protein
MLVSLRSALLIVAALSASSVAPARVGPVEPLIPANSTTFAAAVSPQRIVPEVQESTPAQEIETSADTAPALDPHLSLASMVDHFRSSEPGSAELECLAAGIYFESKSEPLAGQLAVGDVIANRADSGRFAKTYCGVLFQRGQFSFVRGHSWPSITRSSRQWQTAVAIAKIVDQDLQDSPAGKALYFHAKRVSPGWHMQRVASIGNHIFFR